MHKIVFAMGSLLLAASALAQETSTPMSFEDCLQVIKTTAKELKTEPVVVTETVGLRVVRFSTPQGAIALACSKLDKKLVKITSKK